MKLLPAQLNLGQGTSEAENIFLNLKLRTSVYLRSAFKPALYDHGPEICVFVLFDNSYIKLLEDLASFYVKLGCNCFDDVFWK